MDIQFYGANCLVITVQGVRVVIDDNLKELGAKSVIRSEDIALFTSKATEIPVDTKLMIDCPGEYEVSALSIYGIPARSHMDTEEQMTGTMYKIIVDDMSVLVTGHIFPKLSDNQLEKIGIVSTLIIPVGGNGYTLDAIDALSIIKEIEPKVVIPTHYDDQGLKYPIPQQTLEQALKGLAVDVSQTVQKFKLKPNDLREDNLQLVVLEKS
jgi:L-ascorbate metabolism protein UlaG (beta-lactamase superfamily)